MNPLEAYIEPEVNQISIEMEDLPEIVLEVSDYIGGIGEADYYDGEYEVIPKTEEQNLATKGKTMRKDVMVEKIPVHEFSNDSGTTIVIGGIL